MNSVLINVVAMFALLAALTCLNFRLTWRTNYIEDCRLQVDLDDASLLQVLIIFQFLAVL